MKKLMIAAMVLAAASVASAAITTSEQYLLNKNMGPVAFKTKLGDLIANLYQSPTFTGTVTAPVLVLSTSAAPASNAACTAGTIYWSASYIYVCTATGVIKRAALTGGY